MIAASTASAGGVDRRGQGRPAFRDAVDRLAADLRDARQHQGQTALGNELARPSPDFDERPIL
jgi:hypothetical protein